MSKIVPSNGIGSVMWEAQILIETSDVFAWTIAAILMSVLFDALSRIFLGRFDWRMRSDKA